MSASKSEFIYVGKVGEINIKYIYTYIDREIYIYKKELVNPYDNR